MQKPRIWIWLMILISVLAILGNGSVTVFTGGVLSVPSAILLGLFVTSIPMLTLIHLDRRGLKKQGCDPPSAFWTYLFAVILPSYIATLFYYFVRPKENSQDSLISSTKESVGTAFFNDLDEELPPLDEVTWSESNLKNLSETDYNKTISDMIRKDMKEDGIEFIENKIENGTMIFRTSDEDMTVFPMRLDPDKINSSDNAVELVEKIQREYSDGSGITIAVTDTRIPSEVCIDLIDRHGVFLMPEDMTRRNLELHS